VSAAPRWNGGEVAGILRQLDVTWRMGCGRWPGLLRVAGRSAWPWCSGTDAHTCSASDCEYTKPTASVFAARRRGGPDECILYDLRPPNAQVLASVEVDTWPRRLMDYYESGYNKMLPTVTLPSAVARSTRRRMGAHRKRCARGISRLGLWRWHSVWDSAPSATNRAPAAPLNRAPSRLCPTASSTPVTRPRAAHTRSALDFPSPSYADQSVDRATAAKH